MWGDTEKMDTLHGTPLPFDDESAAENDSSTVLESHSIAQELDSNVIKTESAVLKTDSSVFESDSGVENASESDDSINGDPKNNVFSSAESLDDDEPPFMRNTYSLRLKCKNFIEYEKRTTILVHDLPCEFRRRSSVTKNDLVDNNKIEESELNLDRIPTYFKELAFGKNYSADFEVPLNKKPPWYNDEKFKRGQRFAQKHLFCINYAESLSLYLVFSIKSALEPMLFTGKSDTPFRAFSRYLSTLTRVISWYEDDPWSETSNGRRNMMAVRLMHRNVQSKMMAATEEEMARKTTLGAKGEPVWTTARQLLINDFLGSCAIPSPGTCPHMSSGMRVNQYDMAITQFAFVGLAVTYPESFGIHFASDEDLEGFVHLWRTLGYLLGVSDKYNFCNIDLDGVRQRTYDLITLLIKPSLRDVSPEWEHMCRCLTQGIAFYIPGFDFDVSLYYLCNKLKIHTPRLARSLTIWQSFMYRVTDFTFNVLCRIPGVLGWYNKLINRAIAKAQCASPQLLSKWENVQFPYMKNAPVQI